METFGAFESTKIHGTSDDVLGNTRHTEYFREDLDGLSMAGIAHLRYPAPWHRIERKPGEFDFSWMDGPMKVMEKLGMVPVIDLVHHTSFPDWMEKGFADPSLPFYLMRFTQAFIARYPWVKLYTVFNEPLPTTLFCSLTGMWYPHFSSHRDFVAMTLNVCKAISQISTWLKQQNKEHWYIDTCEHHRALDRKIERTVKFYNSRRFLFSDMVLGWVNKHHPLFDYLIQNGAPEGVLSELADNPGCIDVLGLDYYVQTDMDWFWNNKSKSMDKNFYPTNPRGFSSITTDYIRRYNVPIMLSETNNRGTFAERLLWLKYMVQETEQLVANGVDVRGFCWFPYIDSTDWGAGHCCTRSTRIPDPQGILGLSPDCHLRIPSILSVNYSNLAKGQISSKDIPTFCPGSEFAANHAGYRWETNGWNWRELTEREKIAA